MNVSSSNIYGSLDIRFIRTHNQIRISQAQILVNWCHWIRVSNTTNTMWFNPVLLVILYVLLSRNSFMYAVCLWLLLVWVQICFSASFVKKKKKDSWAVFSSDFASRVSEELKLIFFNENKMYMLLNWNPWF